MCFAVLLNSLSLISSLCAALLRTSRIGAQEANKVFSSFSKKVSINLFFRKRDFRINSDWPIPGGIHFGPLCILKSIGFGLLTKDSSGLILASSNSGLYFLK